MNRPRDRAYVRRTPSAFASSADDTGAVSCAFPAAPGLRPTPDRVRETLFNWLGQDLTGWRTLDLYAGSGALSLEAVSRGATLAVAVDRNPALTRALEATAIAFGAQGIEAHAAEAVEYLARETRTFDVVFLDPPFDTDPWSSLLPPCAMLVAPAGFIYAEAAREITPPEGLRVWRHARPGPCIIICCSERRRRLDDTRRPRPTIAHDPCSKSSIPARSTLLLGDTRIWSAARRGCSTRSSSVSRTANRKGRFSPPAERIDMAREVLAPFANVEVAGFSTLLMDFVHAQNAQVDAARTARHFGL